MTLSPACNFYEDGLGQMRASGMDYWYYEYQDENGNWNYNSGNGPFYGQLDNYSTAFSKWEE